jgi:hypothetical protein
MEHSPLEHFMLEHYVPALDTARAAAHARHLQDTTSQLRDRGRAVRWVRAVALPDEESLLCFIDASDIEQVEQVGRDAGAPRAHVQPVIQIEPERTEP